MRVFRNPFAAILALAAASAPAGPPFLTDDPAFPAQGWEIHYAASYERNQGAHVVSAPTFDINYSATPHLQLTLNTGGRVVKERGHGPQAGFADTTAQFKWRFLDESTNHGWPALSVAPALILPTADPERGLGDGLWHLRLPVQAGKTFGNWYAFAEAGGLVSFDGASTAQALYGLGAQYQFTPKFALGVELNGNAHLDHATDHDLIGTLGATFTLSPRWQLLASVGRTLRDESRGGPQILTQLFVIWTF
jgi:hypothetical protein